MPRAKKTTAPAPGTPAARRLARPTVLVDRARWEALQLAILESARKFEWKLVGLDILRGDIPADPVPKGALLEDASPALHRRLRKVGCSLVELQSLDELAARVRRAALVVRMSPQPTGPPAVRALRWRPHLLLELIPDVFLDRELHPYERLHASRIQRGGTR